MPSQCKHASRARDAPAGASCARAAPVVVLTSLSLSCWWLPKRPESQLKVLGNFCTYRHHPLQGCRAPDGPAWTTCRRWSFGPSGAPGWTYNLPENPVLFFRHELASAAAGSTPSRRPRPDACSGCGRMRVDVQQLDCSGCGRTRCARSAAAAGCDARFAEDVAS